MSRYGDDTLRQKKSLGQVFLKTDWPVTRMVEKLVQLRIARVIEIGPGNGILTKALVEAGIRVTAVEKDDRFAARMTEYAQGLGDGPHAGALNVINEDILRFDWDVWLAESGGRAAIVGNIPYNISSPLLQKVIDTFGREGGDKLMAVMFMTQLEFAQRIVARPGTKDYGSLTVFAQLRTDIAMEYTVPRTCFQPVPKVDSAVILLSPKRDVPEEAVLKQTERITRMAFTQRRKKLRNSVRQFMGNKQEADCPIDLERRADTLSPKEFVDLAAFLTGK